MIWLRTMVTWGMFHSRSFWRRKVRKTRLLIYWDVIGLQLQNLGSNWERTKRRSVLHHFFTSGCYFWFWWTAWRLDWSRQENFAWNWTPLRGVTRLPCTFLFSFALFLFLVLGYFWLKKQREELRASWPTRRYIKITRPTAHGPDWRSGGRRPRTL